MSIDHQLGLTGRDEIAVSANTKEIVLKVELADEIAAKEYKDYVRGPIQLRRSINVVTLVIPTHTPERRPVAGWSKPTAAIAEGRAR